MLERWLNIIRAQDQKHRKIYLFLGLIVLISVVAIAVLSKRGLVPVGEAGPQPNSLDTFGLLLDVFWKLGVVLFLIIVSFRLLGRFRSQTLKETNSHLIVLESVQLAPQQALHLIQVGDQTLLIGATDHGLSRLSAVELSPKALEEFQQAGNSASGENLFQSLLQNQLQGWTKDGKNS
jgi:flagellar biogenesis protein FliO